MNRLDDFKINDRLKKEISYAIADRRLPHAMIISGGDSDSRLNFALFLSAAYLCNNEQIPCGVCKTCNKIFNRNHPDVQIFEREKDKKEFSVKIIRDYIKSNAYIKPNEADGKVFIIKDAESMNVSAQNAFLKIFEEPPANVKFILCCDSAVSLLETIRSRATSYSLINAEDNSELYESARNLAENLTLSLMSANEYDFISKTGFFEKDKELFKTTLEIIQMIFRDALAIKNHANILSDNDEIANRLASSFGTLNIIHLIDKTNNISESINKNANFNLLLTRFSSVLRQASRG